MDRFIDRFDLGVELGQGKHGSAHAARRKKDGAVFVIKGVNFPGSVSADILAAVVADAGLRKTLKHPSVVRTYSTFLDDRQLYFVNEYLGGGDIRHFIKKLPTQALPPEALLPLIRSLVEGLRYLHEVGIIHRDIKPSNILVSADGSAAKLDLGESGLAGGAVAGILDLSSSKYLAPEVVAVSSDAEAQRAASCSAAADVWALGASLYTLLAESGAGPLPSKKAAKALADLSRAESALWRMPALPATVPRAIVDLVQSMLTPDPRDRPTPAELLACPPLGCDDDGGGAAEGGAAAAAAAPVPAAAAALPPRHITGGVRVMREASAVSLGGGRGGGVGRGARGVSFSGSGHTGVVRESSAVSLREGLGGGDARGVSFSSMGAGGSYMRGVSFSSSGPTGGFDSDVAAGLFPAAGSGSSPPAAASQGVSREWSSGSLRASFSSDAVDASPPPSASPSAAAAAAHRGESGGYDAPSGVGGVGVLLPPGQSLMGAIPAAEAARHGQRPAPAASALRHFSMDEDAGAATAAPPPAQRPSAAKASTPLLGGSKTGASGGAAGGGCCGCFR
jgi:hypothetical protein